MGKYRDKKPCINCGYTPGRDLTPAETQVIELLGQGLSTKEISSKTYTTLATTRNHVTSILWKLDAHTQLQAVLKWQAKTKAE